MVAFRELPLPEDLLKPRDRRPTLTVPADTFHCRFCPQPSEDATATTVDWAGKDTAGPSGRCCECGQKYQLAHAGDRHLPELLDD